MQPVYLSLQGMAGALAFQLRVANRSATAPTPRRAGGALRGFLDAQGSQESLLLRNEALSPPSLITSLNCFHAGRPIAKPVGAGASVYI